MKKLVLAMMLVFAAQASVHAGAEATGRHAPVNVLLAGGEASNMIWIQLSPDGGSYMIDSVVPLEVGGSVCINPPDIPTELICEAPAVASFEFNADGGDDRIFIGRLVKIPITVRGGPGDDYVIGGGRAGQLSGGKATTACSAEGQRHSLRGAGTDTLVGGSGNDMLRGGPGSDFLAAGSGIDSVRQ